jgi:hypothetical protein
VSLNYTDGSVEGAAYTSDAHITFRQGVGMEYPFTNGTGGVFRPRIWNGVIHYALPGAATYTWSTGDIGFTGYGDVNSDTSFVLESTSPGCPTMYDTIHFTAAAPVADAGADMGLCYGDSALLVAAASGFGPFNYAWDNAVVNGQPFLPLTTAQYILSVTDYLNCADTDTMQLAVHPLPVVMAGNDTTVCNESMLTLMGAGADAYTWDGGVTDGVPFIVMSSMTYEVIGTDSNGCTNNDFITVTSDTIDAAVTVFNETITAVDSAAVSYQWIDCSTNQPIAGETNYWFTATANGSYAVVVNNGMCSDTSACEVILSTRINGQNAINGVSVYPNPNDGVFTLNTGAVAEKIEITDISGRVIEAFVPQQAQLTLSLRSQESGIYFVNVTGADGRIATVKVVKE